MSQSEIRSAHEIYLVVGEPPSSPPINCTIQKLKLERVQMGTYDSSTDENDEAND